MSPQKRAVARFCVCDLTPRTATVTHLDRMAYLCKPAILLRRTIRYACYGEAMGDRVTADHFPQGLTSLRNRKPYKVFKDEHPVI